MTKVKTYLEVIKLSHQHRTKGGRIALITGCFDILHIGHIELFRFAKKNAEIVIVGLDNDKTIKLSKGEDRPVHSLKQRMESLAELSSVDYVFGIDEVVDFGSNGADCVYKQITEMIKPDYLVTNPVANKFWREKQKRAMEIGAKLLLNKRKKTTSTTQIIKKLESEL